MTLDTPLPEYNEIRQMMGKKNFSFQSASINHEGQRVEFWKGVDNNGAVLRRLVNYRMVSMMHCSDAKNVLNAFHYETLGRV